jgi:hypothetical protein
MTCVHFILESLFFLSGIALAVIAGIGLQQLTIAKDIARTAAKRESLKLAADQCLHYVNHVIPDQDALHAAVQAKNIVFFTKSQVEVKGDAVKVHSTATLDEIQALKAISKEFLSVFNAMDAFATFFVSGLADEQIAFSTVGSSYCRTVRVYLASLIITPRYFDNVLKLFFIWNDRIQSQRLQTERQQLEKKLAEVQNKFIKPIGT